MLRYIGSMNRPVDIDGIKISSWAAPTAKDFDILESLTDEQHRALLRREIAKGFDSGLVEKDQDDVWREALRRVRAKTRAADVV